MAERKQAPRVSQPAQEQPGAPRQAQWAWRALPHQEQVQLQREHVLQRELPWAQVALRPQVDVVRGLQLAGVQSRALRVPALQLWPGLLVP